MHKRKLQGTTKIFKGCHLQAQRRVPRAPSNSHPRKEKGKGATNDATNAEILEDPYHHVFDYQGEVDMAIIVEVEQ